MKKEKISPEKISQDLIAFGVKRGDTLLVRADLSQVGMLTTKNKMDYIDAILDCIGEEGTLIGLSFSRDSILRVNKENIFDGTNKSYVGAFSNLMLKHKKASRSTHPTNSYVAIGRFANELTVSHTEMSGAYDLIEKVIELNGKMLLIGCVDSSPGFTTTHLAEVKLNLHKRIIFPSFNKVLYLKNGQVNLFKRKDLGSCSSTFYKFYAYYVREKILKQGIVGNAYTILVDAKDAYAVDKRVLMQYPKITICDNKNCFTCRTRRWDNIKDSPLYLVRFIWHYIRYRKILK